MKPFNQCGKNFHKNSMILENNAYLFNIKIQSCITLHTKPHIRTNILIPPPIPIFLCLSVFFSCNTFLSPPTIPNDYPLIVSLCVKSKIRLHNQVTQQSIADKKNSGLIVAAAAAVAAPVAASASSVAPVVASSVAPVVVVVVAAAGIEILLEK